MKWIWLIFLPFFLQAQKEDYIWVIGDSNDPNTTAHGGMVIDFNHHSPIVDYHYRTVNFRECNASICNSNGELLFYTNGCAIANYNDQILPNGDSLNTGYVHDVRCDQWNTGYAAGHPSVVILSIPGSDSAFYVFHKRATYIQGPPEVIYIDKFYYSIVYMNPQTGQGYVTEKNVELMSDALAFGETGAVKHANGVDWWLITPKRNSNQFYVFLFTANGITDTLTQTIGDIPPANQEGLGQSTFSPDGRQMARFIPYNDIMLYDFNRETGRFSNYRSIGVDYGTSWAYEGGCAFSSSSRFLYISAMKRIYQFDLWASDISATQTAVAEWDGFIDPVSTNFYDCQLGPDCKIYIIAGGDTRYYHIIHNPDEPGLACNVEQHGLVLPTPSGASIPYFPNYRLGPIGNPGQPCMPTVSINPGPAIRVPAVRAWPNPAATQLTLEWSAGLRGPVRINLFDVYGRPVKTATVTAGTGSYTLPVGDLNAGMYRYVVQADAGGVIASGAVAVQK